MIVTKEMQVGLAIILTKHIKYSCGKRWPSLLELKFLKLSYQIPVSTQKLLRGTLAFQWLFY